MKVFALSDIHVDYDANRQWVENLSAFDYRDDVLILAGDVTDSLERLEWCLNTMARRFKKVLFTPGNHELWVIRDKMGKNSMEKFQEVCRIAEDSAVLMQPFHEGGLSIVPLFSWYDYSFGQPSGDLLSTWMDFRACRWPDHSHVSDVTTHFLQLNEPVLGCTNETVISFSHFLPRIDVMPGFIPAEFRVLYSVFGTDKLEKQIRRLKSNIHVYGHSHLNRRVDIDGVTYINNAFGTPNETRIAAKQLSCIYEEGNSNHRFAGCFNANA